MLRDLLDAVLVDLHPVGHHRQRRELQPELVLGRGHFVVVLLDHAAHARHGGEHFRAHVLRGVLRRHREIALLGADVVAEIAAFVVGVGIGRKFDRVELEAGVVGVGAILHVVEHEELGLRAEEDGVADAHRLDHGFGAAWRCRADRGCRARRSVGSSTSQTSDKRRLGEERIDAGGRRIGHQAHVRTRGSPSSRRSRSRRTSDLRRRCLPRSW